MANRVVQYFPLFVSSVYAGSAGYAGDAGQLPAAARGRNLSFLPLPAPPQFDCFCLKGAGAIQNRYIPFHSLPPTNHALTQAAYKAAAAVYNGYNVYGGSEHQPPQQQVWNIVCVYGEVEIKGRSMPR